MANPVTWTGPVWPFTKQEPKYGYQNNPNWAVSPNPETAHAPCGYWPDSEVAPQEGSVETARLTDSWDQQNVTYADGIYYSIALASEGGYHFTVIQWSESESELLAHIPVDSYSSTLYSIKVINGNVVFVWQDLSVYPSVMNITTVTPAGVTSTYEITSLNGNQWPTNLIEAGGGVVIVLSDTYPPLTYHIYLSLDSGLTWVDYPLVMGDPLTLVSRVNSSGQIFIGRTSKSPYATSLYYGSSPDSLSSTTIGSYKIKQLTSNSSHLFMLVATADVAADWYILKLSFTGAILETVRIALLDDHGGAIAVSDSALVVYSIGDLALYRAPISDLTSTVKVFDLVESFQEYVYDLKYEGGHFIFSACQYALVNDYLAFAESGDDGITWTSVEMPLVLYAVMGPVIFTSPTLIPGVAIDPTWPFDPSPNVYGYPTEANWTPVADNADTHTPCGHWHKLAATPNFAWARGAAVELDCNKCGPEFFIQVEGDGSLTFHGVCGDIIPGLCMTEDFQVDTACAAQYLCIHGFSIKATSTCGQTGYAGGAPIECLENFDIIIGNDGKVTFTGACGDITPGSCIIPFGSGYRVSGTDTCNGACGRDAYFSATTSCGQAATATKEYPDLDPVVVTGDYWLTVGQGYGFSATGGGVSGACGYNWSTNNGTVTEGEDPICGIVMPSECGPGTVTASGCTAIGGGVERPQDPPGGIFAGSADFYGVGTGSYTTISTWARPLCEGQGTVQVDFANTHFVTIAPGVRAGTTAGWVERPVFKGGACPCGGHPWPIDAYTEANYNCIVMPPSGSPATQRVYMVLGQILQIKACI